ncbi:MAG TPA: response regulator [Candidatus Limnocylindria bacterium]|nr:response regulator [Candidatus Limnocylindria bacterium]
MTEGAGPVLVVDDDPAIREAVRDALEAIGVRVDTAEDGADALAKVIQEEPCMVLLDMRMPVMDGWGFAHAVQERGMELRVVVMTAAADARRWAREIGAIGVVPKPFALSELVAAVAPCN